jgi:nucleoside-diphosphate-sugar epimerase
MTDRPHIVLTGGSGFLGNHLRQYMIREGLAFSEIRRDCVVVDGQETPHDGDSARIAAVLAPLENPVLVHLAAHFVSRHGPADLAPLVSGTVGFSTLVYDGYFLAGGHSVVTASSAWQYDPAGERAAANLYAALKTASLEVLTHYLSKHDAAGTELVFFDTYGPGDTRPKLIPSLRRHWVEGLPFKASAGLQPINITHADDVSRAIMRAATLTAERAQAGLQTYAVKSGDEMPVRQLVELIRDDIAPGLEVSFQPATPVDAPKALNRSIPTVPGWTPQVALRDGLTAIFKGES